MIQFPRSLARTLRAVFRRLVKKPAGIEHPVVAFRADRNCLRVRLHNTEVLAEFQQAGSYAPETITVPFAALADLDGRGNGVVTLENTGSGKVQARWDDAGTPQVRDYDTPEPSSVATFPAVSTNLQAAGPDLLKAMADASASAARESVRYALQMIQLRGRTGEIVGTDGHQLLIQAGFHFPFNDDLLISSSTLFGCKELAGAGAVTLGADKQFVTIQVGAWTFFFPIAKEGRFPKVEQVIPLTAGAVTRCQVSPEDVSFLVKSLPRLPGGGNEDAPVTVDLNGQVIVRARALDQPRVTEVVLARSEVSGKPVRFSANRDLLARALDLGFTSLVVVNAETPVVCQDSHRKFVFMPLDKKGAIGPSDDALTSTSVETEEPAKVPAVERKRREPVLALLVEESTEVASNRNGDGEFLSEPASPRQRKVNGSVVHDLLAEAAALKDVLRDAFTRTHRLMAGLQRHKKQSRAVQSTLASLRQLQNIGDE